MHPLIAAQKEDIVHVSERLKEQLSRVRTGQASPALVEHIQVEAYGVKTPLVQVASLSAPEPQTLFVEPWDKSIIREIEKALQKSDLGISAVVEADRVRVSIPSMTEESRKRQAKQIREQLEQARIALRKIRDEIKDAILKAEKASAISEDDRYRAQRELDEYTKEMQGKLEALAQKKEVEVMSL